MFWSTFTASIGLIHIYEAHDVGELIGYASIDPGSHAGIQSYVATRHALKWKTKSSLLLTNHQEMQSIHIPPECHVSSSIRTAAAKSTIISSIRTAAAKSTIMYSYP